MSPTAARQIVRLPEGNQAEVLETIRREALSGAELAGVVDLWLGCAERQQQQYLLRHPREALWQANTDRTIKENREAFHTGLLMGLREVSLDLNQL